MSNALFQVPVAVNEPVRPYVPGTSEHKNLISKYKEMYDQAPIDVPMHIGGKEVRTSNKMPMSPPHDHKKVLGHFKSHPAALRYVHAHKLDWTNMPAELLAVKTQEA